MPTTGGLRPTVTPALALSTVAQVAGADATDAADSTGLLALQVTGASLDSRAIHPGDLYAALPGAHAHGADFTAAAASAGAVAVLTDPAGQRAARLAGLPTLVVADPRAVLGRVCAAIYGEPAEQLLMLGVTGTNGKTTTAYLLDAALRAAGRSSGLVGTVETRVGDERLDSVRTTPEAPDLQALLALMVERGCSSCAMEVSSHALALHRVDGVAFDVAGFTNLSQDHLDFHHDQEDYFAAKASLFTPDRCRSAVICVDDSWGRRLAAQVRVPLTTLRAMPPEAIAAVEDSRLGQAADWVVTEHRADRAGAATDFTMRGPQGRILELRSPLPGDFNVANTALAALMLLAAGLPAGGLRAGLAGAVVPGRMERVPAPQGGPLGVVDYAHTPEAISAALRALRSTTTGCLVIVIGAGGDRDRAKRALMGAAAARQADVVVITDDNPRSEDPAAIRAQLLEGAHEARLPDGGRGSGRPVVLEVGDRRAAITRALSYATQPADTILVAGKGHERGQDIGGFVLPFDDRAVLAEALRIAAGAP